ncbi:MAG TPA: DUF4845 domain-containing protein [Gallionella sp.]|nr:DUF4845 domain-containing protein [Gallionella sp.]
MRNKQRGISMSGLLMSAFLLFFGALLAMKLIPPYVHSSQIAQIFRSMSSDPALAGASIKDIKDAYFKRATVNSITDITGEDIEIDKEGGVLKLSANYSVKIPLVANITLLIEFNPSSS